MNIPEGHRNTHENSSALNHLRKARREIFNSENAKVEPHLATTTFAIAKKDGKYILNNIELYLKDNFHCKGIKDSYVIQYQNFVESLRALLVNVDFVMAAINFGLQNKKGVVNDINYLQSLKFEYSAELRSKFGYTTKPNAITSSKLVVPTLISVLNKSQELVNAFDPILGDIKANVPELAEKIDAKIDLRTKLFIISAQLVTGLENSRFNVKEFEDQIYYGPRPTPAFGLI